MKASHSCELWNKPTSFFSPRIFSPELCKGNAWIADLLPNISVFQKLIYDSQTFQSSKSRELKQMESLFLARPPFHHSPVSPHMQRALCTPTSHSDLLFPNSIQATSSAASPWPLVTQTPIY